MVAIAEDIPSATTPWPLVARAPFTSARRFSGASFADHGHWVLGATDVLVTGDVAARAEEASTATLTTLIISAVWVVSIVARPFVPWRLGMVVFGYAFYTALFLWPPTQRLLDLDISNPGTMMVGILTGAIGTAAIEATWWISARIRGERPLVWRQRAAVTT